MKLQDNEVWMLVYFGGLELPHTSKMLQVASWNLLPSAHTLNRAMLADMSRFPYRRVERYSCIKVSNVSEPTPPPAPDPELRFR